MGLEVQKRSIQMAQKNLDITGHNLGNIGTPGFTRQRVDVSSLSISSFTYWQTSLSKLSLAGQGVTAFGVSQIRNEYLDRRYREMVPFAREYDIKLKIMTELETTLDNIDNFGLLTAFDRLKSSLEQVSLVQADAREMTSQVRNNVGNIAQMLSVYHNDLSQLLENNVNELRNSVTAANNLISKIVTYNEAITKEYLSDAGRIMRGQGVSEYGPLELLDQRNLLLDELAQYGNIEVFLNNNGSVRVTMAGVTIIDDQASERIVLHDYHEYNAAVLNFSNGVDFRPTTGEIKAYTDMVNGNGPYSVGRFQNSEFGIPYYLQALDAFAAGFAELMNQTNAADLSDENTWNRTLLWGGFEYNIDGTRRQAADDDGNLRFDSNGDPIWVKAKVTASNIKISDEWMRDELLIGQTFVDNAIESYSLGNHPEGSVFMDNTSFPPTYYFVDSGSFNAARGDTIATAAAPGGNITQLPVHVQNTFNPVANHSSTRVNYAVGDVFIDPRTSVVYRVTADHTVGRAITDLSAARNAVPPTIEAIGVDESRWQAANLDGSNLLRFVRSLESPQSWGRAMDFNGSTFEYLMFLSDRLGTGIDFIERQFEMTMDTVNTLLDNRDAISGVSETEEGINMLTYQKWFNASARLMTTLDEALDTIINRMGRVGL
jgi:flagellar hook-associated protein FlgK